MNSGAGEDVYKRQTMGEKKNVITNLVELGKRNQKITTKEINDALEEIGFEVELVDKLYEALDANNIEIVDEPCLLYTSRCV